MAPVYEYLFLFVFLGAGLKIIDDIYDFGALEKKTAHILAPALVSLWVYLSAIDKGFATLLGAILLSSLITGKVDNRVFKLSAAAVTAAWLLWGIKVFLEPFIVLTLLGILDETLDRYGERKVAVAKKAGLEYLLTHRVGMKLGVVILFAFAQLELPHVLAMLAFDLAYEIAPASLNRGRCWIKGVVDV